MMPDKYIVPKKYQTLISPSLRRVFLDALEDSGRAVIKNFFPKSSLELTGKAGS
jgi:hypothetical protein